MNKALMIFDGDCGFCRYWIKRWNTRLKDQVDFKPFQEFETLPSGVEREDCQKMVVLVGRDGHVFKGAEAVFRALSLDEKTLWPIKLYDSVPGIRPATEAVYRVVAGNRPFFSKLTKMFLQK